MAHLFSVVNIALEDFLDMKWAIDVCTTISGWLNGGPRMSQCGFDVPLLGYYYLGPSLSLGGF